jgi:hypothetical protein
MQALWRKQITIQIDILPVQIHRLNVYANYYYPSFDGLSPMKYFPAKLIGAYYL